MKHYRPFRFSLNPILKWGLIVLVGLYALVFLGERAIDLYGKSLDAKRQEAEIHAKTQKPVRFCKLDNPPCPD